MQNADAYGAAMPDREDVMEVLREVDQPLATVHICGALDAVARLLGHKCANTASVSELLNQLRRQGRVVKGTWRDYEEAFGVARPDAREASRLFPTYGGQYRNFAWWASAENVRYWKAPPPATLPPPAGPPDGRLSLA